MSALFQGLTFALNDPSRKSPTAQALVSGLSLNLLLRRVNIAIYRLDAGAYVPLAGYPVTLNLDTTGAVVNLVTNASGGAYAEFSDLNIVVNLAAGSVPAGYSAPLTYAYSAGVKNDVVITFLPILPARRYQTVQVV